MADERRQGRWRLISLLVGVAILGGIGWFLSNNAELIGLLRDVSWIWLAALALLRILFLGINGLFLQACAGRLGVQLRFFEWFGLPFMTTMANYLTPLSGGMLARAAYLKRRHQLPYVQFLSLLSANYLIIFGASGIVGLITMFALPANAANRLLLMVFFALISGAVVLLLLLPGVRLPGRWRVIRLANRALDGWTAVTSDSRLLVQLFVYGFGSVLLNALAFWAAYRALQLTVSWQTAVLVSLSTIFSTLLTVTPGNLGVREAIIGLVSELAGVGVGEGLVVALLIRASTLLSAFTLGPLFSFMLTRQLGDVPAASPD